MRRRAEAAGAAERQATRSEVQPSDLSPGGRSATSRQQTSAPRPYTLVAELTYRCPLRCPYCSNPVEVELGEELATGDWLRVIDEAAGLGVLQAHFTGGEPLVREDLEALVARARAAGLYTNLVTSGVPLDAARLAGLARAGLDHVQLSFQDADAAAADRIAGRPAHERKLAVAGWVRAEGLPLTVNVVLHRENLPAVDAIVDLAERLGASRLELANTQYLGWALANRDALLPSEEAVAAARRQVAAARARLEGKMEIAFVLPDHHARWPRACMDGWARRFIVVSPDGRVLPCQAAHTIRGLRFDDVRSGALAAIWEGSPGLARFRGTEWMPEPCRGCDRREIDFGGCRCQAFHLLGDAAATDPACSRSPHHAVIEEARRQAAGGPFVPRAAVGRRPR
jgi:pyrroloquinoline quinone biosynthesis protein E